MSAQEHVPYTFNLNQSEACDGLAMFRIVAAFAPIINDCLS